MFKKIFIKFIQSYQAIFPGGGCRFVPSCSQYSCEAVNKYGIIKGSWLTLKRLARCHPLNPGGIDTLD